MRVECTCQGLNENCFRCFGKGYYNKNELASTTGKSIKRKSSKVTNPSTGKKKKVILYNSSYIDKQNEKIKQRKSLKHSLVTCPHCGSFVRDDRIEYHVKRVHYSIYEKNSSVLLSPIPTD